MYLHELSVARDHQEQLRAEAARNRQVPSTSRVRRVLASVASIVRASFEAPALTPGSVLPAIH